MSEILEVPNSWKAGIITNQGRGLLSKLVKGHTLSITRAETGAGYVDPELLEQQTAITDPKQTLSFDAVSYPEEGKCVIPCKLTNAEVTESYIARQIGLYAEDPDKGTILFYITQVEDDDGGTGIPSVNLIPSYSATWNLVIYYGMADGVDVTVDPAGSVTQEEMEQTIQKYANGVGSAKIRTITIPAAGWVAAGELAMGGYDYIAEVAIEEATENHFPTMALDILSLEPAGRAGLCPTIETLDGAMRFWAVSKPKADLTGTILLRSENLVKPEDIDLNFEVATDTEVNETIEDVFRGNGETDGEDSPSEDAPSDDTTGGEVATDEEVEEVINGIFGK